MFTLRRKPMLRMSRLIPLILVLSAARVLAADDPLFARLNQADTIFIATVFDTPTVKINNEPHPKIVFEKPVEIWRGAVDRQNYDRPADCPPVKKGDKIIVALVRDIDTAPRIVAVVLADEKGTALAKSAVGVPLGWNMVDDKPVSPFAVLGDKAWSKECSIKSEPICSATSRPALWCPRGLRINLDQMLIRGGNKDLNPYGDGRFKVTIQNMNKQAVDVPPLLTDGKEVLWADSLVVLCDGKPYLLPGAGKAATAGPNLKPVHLEPGRAVVTTIDLLPIPNIPWPRTQARIHFRLCLGDAAVATFFQYTPAYHDKLRDEMMRGGQ